VDPTNPIRGGHAHVKCPGQKFFHQIPVDDVELDIVFNGGDAIDGLFDLKVDYNFVQKFTFLADRPQQGTVVVYRKLEGGQWKTKVTVENTKGHLIPSMDIAVDSDRAAKLHATFQYDVDNHWEVKLDRVSDNSITGVATINGVEHHIVGTLDAAAKKLNVKVTGHGKDYNVDFHLLTTGEWAIEAKGDVDGPVESKVSISQDFKNVEIVAKYNNKNYAFIKATGDAVVQKMIPTKVDYTAKYNILDSMFEGKAKVNYNGQAPKKTVKLSIVPKTGKDLTIDYDIEFTARHGWKSHYEATRGGVTYYKLSNVVDVNANNARKFDMHFASTLDLIPESYMYSFWCSYVGKCFTSATRDIKVTYHKKAKNFLLGKMKIEDVSTIDGEKFHERKLDTTGTPYTLTWYRPHGPAMLPTTQSLFGVDQVDVKAWHTVGKELKIVTNVEGIQLTVRRDPDYFVEFIKNGETLLKSQTDITPDLFTTQLDTLFHVPSDTVFHKFFCSYGKGCFNKRQGHIKVVVDRHNKNALLNKFEIDSHVKKDDEVVFEFSTSTRVTPYTVKLRAPHVLPNFFHDPTRETIEGTVNHVPGDKLEVKTNCPEVKTLEVNTVGGNKHVVLNGKEVFVVDYTTGDKKISQTTQLSTGEHATTTLEWTTKSIKQNKVKLTVEVTPNRKFEGTFDWHVKPHDSADLTVDIKGSNPYLGDYEIHRKGDFKCSPADFVLNWAGKTTFANGPLSHFSPIDTDMKFNFNKASYHLNADVVKTINGKHYGVNVAENKLSVVGGAA